MKSRLECLECAVRQALRVARAATDDVDIHRAIVNEVAAAIPSMDLNTSPAVLSLLSYTKTHELSGNPDPFKQDKIDQNTFALQLEDDLRAMVAASDDPLDTALHLAAAGNVIDLGTGHAANMDDVYKAIDDALHQRFAVDHSGAFRDSLAKCDDLLYLLDNAGEIVFDKILIEELVKYTHVTAVVKAGPIINDVLMADAEQVGLTDVCPVIDNGGALVGSPPDLVSPGFLERMKQADVLLCKGQGNYETVDALEDADTYFILRAKCEIIAEDMGVQYGQVVMISQRVRKGSSV